MEIGKEKNIDSSSNFSKFFREASYKEKKKVYLEMIRNATREQLEIVKNANLHDKARLL
jgi:hypothetical protein